MDVLPASKFRPLLSAVSLSRDGSRTFVLTAKVCRDPPVFKHKTFRIRANCSCQSLFIIQRVGITVEDPNLPTGWNMLERGSLF